MSDEHLSEVFSGRVIFDHLPKCGGQAVNNWLRKNLGTGCVTGNLIGQHQALVGHYGGSYPIISGHIEFQKNERLLPFYDYVTCLREPVDRSISWLYYVLNDVAKSKYDEDIVSACKNFLDTDGEENDYKGVMALPQNPYVMHFSQIASETVGNEVDRAIAAISQYKLIGLFSDMDQFVGNFARFLELSSPCQLERFNATTSKPEASLLGENVISRIKEINTLDIEFFEKCKDLSTKFSARISRIEKKKNYIIYNEVQKNSIIYDECFEMHSVSMSGDPFVEFGQMIIFNIDFTVNKIVKTMELGLHVHNVENKLFFGVNSTILGQNYTDVLPGRYNVKIFMIADLPFGNSYTVGFAVADISETPSRQLYWIDKAIPFDILKPRGWSCPGMSRVPTKISLIRSVAS